ncbi:MFS transporter [Pseudomonas helleri]|uniref:MFS transporter n=1 Tax=Pseudomonas helleri TaxID=1608996 RepID=UPI00382B134B
MFIALIALAVFFDFFDLMLSGSVTAALLTSGWSTRELNVVFLSVTGLGGIISNLVAGALADRFGRRRVFRGALLLVGLGTLACAAAPRMEFLIGARFIASLGMAAVPGVGLTLMNELLPVAVRGRWVSASGVISTSSLFAAALAGYLLLPWGGWHWMFIIPGAGCLVLYCLTAVLPESPRWLATRGRHEAARQALSKMHIDEDGPLLALNTLERSGEAPVDRLFTKALVKPLVLGVVLAVGFNVATTGFLTWLPMLLLERHLSISNTLAYNLMMSLGIPLGGLACTMLADRISRKAGIIGAAVTALLLAAAFPFTSGYALIGTGFVLQVSMGVLSTLIMGLYLAELYPTNVRARATALSMATVRLVMVFLPFLLLTLLNVAGVVGVMAVVVICLLVIVFAMFLLGIETSGKSLDRI